MPGASRYLRLSCMKPLLTKYERPTHQKMGETIDQGTFQSPIYKSLLIDRDAEVAKSTLITRVKNETTDDN